MTVAELIDELKKHPLDALVVQAKDGEGNGFSPVTDIELGRYVADDADEWRGQFGLAELTDELREAGYSEEDVLDGPLAVCLWPA